MEDLGVEDHELVRLDLKSIEALGRLTIEEVQVDENYNIIVLRREVYGVFHYISSTVNQGTRESR